MAIASTTRTHLIYQFIILTLLFLSIGYNELLPDRKFVLFLAFIPIFCYQLVLISCCLELIRLPQWMRFLENSSRKRDSEESNRGHRTSSLASTTLVSSGVQTNTKLTFPDISEIPCQRRWERNATNLGAAPKYLTKRQKAKSWMSLEDSKSSEKLLSREGSFDALSGRKCSFRVADKTDKVRNREERAKKAKSWKPGETFNVSSNEFAKTSSLSMESTKPSVSNYVEAPQETELSKSYSFPFRQKRLETWLERKEGQSTDSLDMPYWKSVGYNLAVKYEARRRRRAMSRTTNSDIPEEPSYVMQKPPEIVYDSVHKQNSKKGAKSASACINKIKVGFSNLMSKKKDEVFENNNPNKAPKSNLLHKLKTKNTCPTKEIEKHEASMPEFPQFLNDRPLIFYPNYLPFEKERFETDVKNKMKELADGMKANCST